MLLEPQAFLSFLCLAATASGQTLWLRRGFLRHNSKSYQREMVAPYRALWVYRKPWDVSKRTKDTACRYCSFSCSFSTEKRQRNIWVNCLSSSTKEKLIQRVSSHTRLSDFNPVTTSPLPPLASLSCKEMPLIVCRTCNAARPKITNERIKTAGKGDGTKHRTYISICHCIGRSDTEKGDLSQCLSFLLLWISLLSVSHCGKQ